jgi:hypothetical protein
MTMRTDAFALGHWPDPDDGLMFSPKLRISKRQLLELMQKPDLAAIGH